MTMDYPHIEVEQTFDEIVREYGGAIVLREKIGKSPDFANADYIFHFEKVVAELKCLMDDNSDSRTVQSKINFAIDRYHADGKIKTKEINETTWRDFPVELQNDIYTVTTTSIQARIKKANRQIRETKERLGLRSYNGLLIIANDGLISMPPAAFVHAIQKYVKNNCSEISAFIFLTVNVFAAVRGVQMPVVFWFPMSMDEPAKIDEELITRLRISWQRLVSLRMEAQPFDHQMNHEDMGAFWKAKNIPKSE